METEFSEAKENVNLQGNEFLLQMASYSPMARDAFRRNIVSRTKLSVGSSNYIVPQRLGRPRVVYGGDDIDFGPAKIYREVDGQGLGLRYTKNVVRYEMPCHDPDCICKGNKIILIWMLLNAFLKCNLLNDFLNKIFNFSLKFIIQTA